MNKLAEDCRFGRFQDRLLQDCIAGGTNEKEMQQQLFEIPDLTFDIVKKTVMAMEAASRNSWLLSMPNQ